MMMFQRFLCVFVAPCVLMATFSNGFSVSSMEKKKMLVQQKKDSIYFSISSSSTSSSLSASVTIFNEPEAQFQLAKAKECAFSDTCPIDEARDHLHDVLHIQEACAGGTIVGHELCDEQDVAAEIVALLRNKVENGVENSTTSAQQLK